MSLTAKDVAALKDAPVSDYRAARLYPYGMVDSKGSLTPLGAQLAFHEPSRIRHAEVHVLAILKNAIEKPADPDRHFGDTRRYLEFVDAGVDWGLLSSNHAPTQFGIWFYDFWHLGTLPESRANEWRLSSQLALVLRLLDGKRL